MAPSLGMAIPVVLTLVSPTYESGRGYENNIQPTQKVLQLQQVQSGAPSIETLESILTSVSNKLSQGAVARSEFYTFLFDTLKQQGILTGESRDMPKQTDDGWE